MNLAPKKLVRAFEALHDVLSNGRSVAVASAVALAREIADVSERTIHAARSRLPITCDREGDGPGFWRLADAPAAPPVEWKTRRLLKCRVCGTSLEGMHWRTKRCRACGGRPSSPAAA
jgi:hypothetical protein